MNDVNQTIQEKYARLQEILRGYGTLAVAFSGGVDSTFLLRAAIDALGTAQIIAVTARSCSFPERELNEAARFCESYGVRHFITDSEELEIDGFAQNPPNRCYLCKTELFTKIDALAQSEGMAHVAEASNLDDEGDYRPGLTAVAELGVKSPLREAGFTKDEIRAHSRSLGLPTWDKQSFACLASRFVYGETITEKKLGMVDKAEQLLLDLGFTQLRVRVHGEDGAQARIEVRPNEFPRLIAEETRETICRAFTELGFKYISMDLMGYRTGSMNETLTE